MSTDVDEILAHYGVPGMKWGKRKARSSDGSDDSAPKEKKVRKPLTTKQKVAIGVGVYAAAHTVKLLTNEEFMNTVKLVGMDKAKKHAGAKYARNLLADKRGIAAYQTIRLVANGAGGWS